MVHLSLVRIGLHALPRVALFASNRPYVKAVGTSSGWRNHDSDTTHKWALEFLPLGCYHPPLHTTRCRASARHSPNRVLAGPERRREALEATQRRVLRRGSWRVDRQPGSRDGE